MVDWSNDDVLSFLEHYQNEPVIWDPMDSHHKEKRKVNEAWARLSEKLQRPIPEMKMKKDSLMATFRKHIRKKRGSIVYKPVWFAYEFMENFLAPIYNSIPTIKNESFVNETFHEDDGEVITPNIITTPSTSTEDECDLFGKILAKKLRKLPENERQIFMYDIDKMFIKRIRPNTSRGSSEESNLNRPPSNLSYSDPESPVSDGDYKKRRRVKRGRVLPLEVVLIDGAPTNSKPTEFICKFCNKSFPRRRYLHEHELRHSSEKPFQCKYCGKLFVRSSEVTRHERVHTGERPFKCTNCEKCFRRREHLYAHQRAVHSRE